MKPARIFLWLLLALVVSSLLFLALRVATKSSMGLSMVEHLMGNFRDETAQTRFMSYATKITPLSRLEVAKLEQIEVFDRTSDEMIFWKILSLPQVVVRATLPVEYRYYVEFAEPWQVELEDRVLTVTAPALKPGTPSPNISELRYEVRKGSLFRSEKSVEKALNLELTKLLEKRARDNVSLVKETARQQISEIAKNWLNSESKQVEVIVRFADEAAPLQAR